MGFSFKSVLLMAVNAGTTFIDDAVVQLYTAVENGDKSDEVKAALATFKLWKPHFAKLVDNPNSMLDDNIINRLDEGALKVLGQEHYDVLTKLEARPAAE